MKPESTCLVHQAATATLKVELMLGGMILSQQQTFISHQLSGSDLSGFSGPNLSLPKHLDTHNRPFFVSFVDSDPDDKTRESTAGTLHVVFHVNEGYCQQ